MSVPKIGKNATSVSKLLFSTINLHFVTSNQKSTYRKLNLTLPFLSLSLYLFLKQYLFRLPTSRNTKKTQADQSMSHVFLLCLKKKNDPQTFKSGSCKQYFLQCACYWYSLLGWMFFILFDNYKRHYFSWKFIVTLRLF